MITSKLDIEDRKLAVVEVARNKVHRTLEERMLLRFLNTTTRWVLIAATNRAHTHRVKSGQHFRRVYCLELLGVEDDCRDDLAASAMSSLSSSRFRSRHILLKGICIALIPSRSDLCPSTTVSSSTSTGTLTDTGTITEVKLILHFKQDFVFAF